MRTPDAGKITCPCTGTCTSEAIMWPMLEGDHANVPDDLRSISISARRIPEKGNGSKRRPQRIAVLVSFILNSEGQSQP